MLGRAERLSELIQDEIMSDDGLRDDRIGVHAHCFELRCAAVVSEVCIN